MGAVRRKPRHLRNAVVDSTSDKTWILANDVAVRYLRDACYGVGLSRPRGSCLHLAIEGHAKVELAYRNSCTDEPLPRQINRPLGIIRIAEDRIIEPRVRIKIAALILST